MIASEAACGLTAVQMSSSLARGELRAVDLARAHLARIDRLNPKLNAFCAIFHQEALAAGQRHLVALIRKGF